ncbi:unnamed protein product [Didymodactylos carnosus]|uniref:Ubiquitin carboxyl-terminal hydrolase n=1 Tax=Didymodactylos carnosus TaxID=1234261 RepID=A0A813VFN9_9BILA|nr:unnamed protein product [Didymodactylos carnosus]CAF0906671.1 unnamed protein product [Didymodactylos carnosus]CAF3632315.1 unnamed protein product [Didymodactylos carnosus]CAF3686458.1 unnamed protein product [Didymodactylos carnosus]
MSSSSPKIELYLAKDLEELNDKVTKIPAFEKLKTSNCVTILSLIEPTWKDAKTAEQNGDEERAYIQYMRLFECLHFLKNTNEDKQNPAKGSGKYKLTATLWYEKAQELSNSLKTRYDERDNKNRMEEQKKQDEIAEEKSLVTTIRPQQLYKYLQKNRQILLIDMRPSSLYKESHMKYSCCINIPGDMVGEKGWTPWYVESALSDEQSKLMFKNRSSYDYIVLFDTNSVFEKITVGHVILGLKNAIYTFDQDNKLKHQPLVLDGGYEDWSSIYPAENTAPVPKKSTDEIQPFEVHYPEDIYLPEEIPAKLPTAVFVPPSEEVKPVVKPADHDQFSQQTIEKLLPLIDRARKPKPPQQQIPSKVDDVNANMKYSEELDAEIKKTTEEQTNKLPIDSQSENNQISSTISDSPIRTEPVMPNRAKKPQISTNGSQKPIIDDTNHTLMPNVKPEVSLASPQPSTDAENIPPQHVQIPPQQQQQRQQVGAPLSLAQKIPLDTVYRPFLKSTPVDAGKQIYQKKFDSTTGKKIFLDPRNNQLISDLPDAERYETPRISTQSESYSTPQQIVQTQEVPNRVVPSTSTVSNVPPTIERYKKLLINKQQIAADYCAMPLTVKPQPNMLTGLENLGNSCYMNAVIQSLSYNHILTNYFLSGDFSKDINVTNKLGYNGVVANEYLKLVHALWSRQFGSLRPIPFKIVVGKIQQAYWDTKQQDAHEFLVFLLDCLHEDLNRIQTRPKMNEIKTEDYHDNDTLLADVTWRAFKSHNDSIIVDQYHGLFRSTAVCSICKRSSKRFDPFICLSLPIPPRNVSTIEECLSKFEEPELLTGNSRWNCPNCKVQRDARKQIKIWKLPKQLIVQFKRFRLTSDNRWVKNESLIRHPINDFDLTQWTLTSSPKYSLYAVVNHLGSMNAGHYTSYCRDFRTNDWYLCNDDRITQINPTELSKNQNAYLLFYTSMKMPIISMNSKLSSSQN